MKMAVIHPRMSVLGGAERVAIHSLRAGLRAGHRVYLVSEDFDQSYVENFFGCEGLFSKVERLTYPVFRPKLFGSVLLYRQLYYHRRQTQRMLSEQADIELMVSTQDVGYVPSTRARVIHYCYFPDYFKHVETGPSSRRWRLYYWPARKYYHHCVNRVDQFLSTSDYTKDFVKRIWKKDSTTLYPPCPVDLYKSEGKSKEDLVITVGRLVPEKRFEIFLEVARQLPLVKFIAIGMPQKGNEKYSEFLRMTAPRNVSFMYSPLRKASEILARASVYIHCAENEQFGISIVEAMAAGCVPVVHDSGGPREIVTDNTGFRWRDASQASASVSLVIRDPGMRRELSEAAMMRASKFSSDNFESSMANMLVTGPKGIASEL
jgi:alpha-1,2-mannosyltransferase